MRYLEVLKSFSMRKARKDESSANGTRTRSFEILGLSPGLLKEKSVSYKNVIDCISTTSAEMLSVPPELSGHRRCFRVRAVIMA